MEPLEQSSNRDVLSHLAGETAAESLTNTYSGLAGGVMPGNQSVKPTAPDPPVRQLTIEAVGDFWKGLILPKIRLTGRWLERAGFNPGGQVRVTCVAPGVMELRSLDAVSADDSKPLPPEPPDCPF